ncbi:hypothetical protein O163_10365 [Caldanaerobacter subterraneus subsp. yonseiensis KB-1]|uniref:Uncharacterized protein n=1 Tax=Caldanaerobacter subterraneus subsp. yonseiensis KB-1 TaxID=1388761 RepID=U5CTN3_CALSX|nr:hypothetical protein [Caldanaerobacter subterraneus]ERM91462.1 hypothetical protein O163_10365 [Caldanaerobacter subterraneus subsp. yonseiensis KB-1]
MLARLFYVYGPLLFGYLSSFLLVAFLLYTNKKYINEHFGRSEKVTRKELLAIALEVIITVTVFRIIKLFVYKTLTFLEWTLIPVLIVDSLKQFTSSLIKRKKK